MRALVTGATGFIGSQIVKDLLARGDEVVAYSRMRQTHANSLPEHANLTVKKGDVNDFDALKLASEGVDAIIHLADVGALETYIKQPELHTQQSLSSFLNILKLVREHNLRFVYASSAAVYGNQEGKLPETTEKKPISPYGAEKSGIEEQAFSYMRMYKISALGLRIFNAYGPGQRIDSTHVGVVARLLDRLKNNQPIQIYGDGSQTRDFIHVEDISTAFCLALDKPEVTGVLNVASGEETKISSLVAMLAELSGQTAQIDYQPERDGDIQYSVADTTEAEQKLGFKAKVTLEQGLKSVVKFSTSEI
jgi:UDP-glucose 4-epimerase